MSDKLPALLADLSKSERDLLQPVSQPDWYQPMLATLTDERFSDSDWIFERKLDGERALVMRNGDQVGLFSRNRKDIGISYPELLEAVASQSCRHFIADGEIVAFAGRLTSFARLQQRMQLKNAAAIKASRLKVYFYLFDLLYLDKYDLTALPLRSRKNVLQKALSFSDPLRYTTHRNKTGEAFFDQACSKGWEGIIAKRAAAGYQQRRSRDWLKFKCAQGQELVVGGFSKPQGSRKGFGALLLGYYQDDKLRYAGRVGTGFDDNQLLDLHRQLQSMTRQSSPFADDVRERDVTWVKPELVAQIGFTEWTCDNKLRHPRFMGLRRDKTAIEVIRERAES
jgi:DNA ligase D-like protein (predicted ligase)